MVGSQAALPRLDDVVIIVAGLSEQTGMLETDTALVAGWRVYNMHHPTIEYVPQTGKLVAS